MSFPAGIWWMPLLVAGGLLDTPSSRFTRRDLLLGLLATAGLCLFLTNSLNSSSSGGGL